MRPAINLLDPGVGIQNLMPPDERGRMPGARPLASAATTEPGLEALFPGDAAEAAIAEALRPPVGDGSILQPEIFRAELRGSLEALETVRHPDVRAFVREELRPLLENTELLNACTGLMIGG